MTANDHFNIINKAFSAGYERLAALKAWKKINGNRSLCKSRGETNCHIHTIYSFSPYTPSMAALQAFEANLEAAGSVDHDSISAAQEMLNACAVLGIGGCAGFEVRAGFKKGADGKPSVFADRKMNNPDSKGLVYMTVQGIPKPYIKDASDFLKPVREERLKRTREMTVSANVLLREAGFKEIDFEKDIFAKSKYSEGGGITERHLLAAAAEKIIDFCKKKPDTAEILALKMGIKAPPKIASLLSDPDNPHYLYDLLGVLKAQFLPLIFIQPDDNECIPADRVTSFARLICAVSAYAYLGDVLDSPTGDKKAEKFEDDFIDDLFAELSRLDFKAVAYMPVRNTPEQLGVLRRLSREWGFMEISGADINSSRQSFNCPQILTEEFHHLTNAAWALIAHEKLAGVDKNLGLFSRENPLSSFIPEERLAAYSVFGKKLDLFHPDESACEIAEEIKKGRLL